MTWLILTIILGIIFVGGVLLALAFRKNGHPDDKAGGQWLFGGIAALSGFLWLILTIASMVHTVDAGHVGVVYTFGEITGQTEEGFQLTAPWQSLKEANVQVQRHTFGQGGGDNTEIDRERDIDAFSEESQDVFIVATINYQVSPEAIQGLYRNVGANWFDRLVLSRVLQFVKDETVKYPTVDIAPNREQIRVAVRDRLRVELAPYSVSVVDFLIDNIEFPQAFKDAITSKQVAEQEALRAEEQIRQREAEAEQRRVEAQGIADSNVITAEGQAEANQLLAQSLTDEVIQYQAIQKLADDIEIALIPSGEGVIIDPSTILGGE